MAISENIFFIIFIRFNSRTGPQLGAGRDVFKFYF